MEEREGLLIENTENINDNIYKDTDSEKEDDDDELLTL